MRVPHNSFVLVADARKRLFFRNEGDADAPNLIVVEAVEEDNPPTRVHGTDAPGRASSAVSGGASLAGADPHRIEEERFAADTAAMLRTRTLAGETESLIVVAPPRTLGALRKHYHGAVEKRIVRELGKDLTGHTVTEIGHLLAAQD
jgi:protein required for attachment to host cells